MKNAELRRAFVGNYLGVIAASRAAVTYPDGKLPNHDWDGKPYFDSVNLPDQQTYDDIRTYNAGIVQVSTPEEKCIGFPEQKYISEAGKKGR